MNETPQDRFTFVVPARMASRRFPGKVLKALGGRAVLDWVYNNCSRSRFCGGVIVGTDAQEVRDHCQKRNWAVCMTREHNCCSNRTAEVVSALSGEWIVEVQSDEPFLWASTIDRWLERAIPLLGSTTKIDVFISASELPAAHVENPNFVKIIKNADDKLLWASRSKIPSCFGGRMATFFRHAGLYLWRRESLLRFAEIAPGPIEDSEDTHALRLLENEFWAQVILMPGTQGIDVPADLVAAERYVWDNRALIAEETGLQP